MNKILTFTFLLTLINFSYSQDYVVEETVTEIRDGLVRSDFSIGISTIVYVPVNNYSDGPGVGLELLGLYRLNSNYSVGGFLKIKSELNESAIGPPGSGYNSSEKVFQNVAGSIGAIIEYKIFDKVGFNLRAGYEDVFASTAKQNYNYNYYNSPTVIYEDNDPGFVYGGGISLYIRRSDSKRAIHSFNWAITFESNNFKEVPILDISNNEFKDQEINAFYLQFGWRIQFHGLIPKR